MAQYLLSLIYIIIIDDAGVNIAIILLDKHFNIFLRLLLLMRFCIHIAVLALRIGGGAVSLALYDGQVN
jgi:hypothetical protein